MRSPTRPGTTWPDRNGGPFTRRGGHRPALVASARDLPFKVCRQNMEGKRSMDEKLASGDAEAGLTSLDSRRDFLDRAGKVALAVPPALTLLLVAEGRHYALALSDTVGGPRGNSNG